MRQRGSIAPVLHHLRPFKIYSTLPLDATFLVNVVAKLVGSLLATSGSRVNEAGREKGTIERNLVRKLQNGAMTRNPFDSSSSKEEEHLASSCSDEDDEYDDDFDGSKSPGRNGFRQKCG
eukprot:scaffold2791_cov154-Amphora_coffeaeformis.AAC.3